MNVFNWIGTKISGRPPLLRSSGYAVFGAAVLFVLHHLPVNQLFIDPFSEAVKDYDLMDIAISQFRDHHLPELYDDRIAIVNTGVTDRSDLACALELLSNQPIAAIGLDLLLDTLYRTPEDSLLRDAVALAPKLVFGYTFREGHQEEEAVADLRTHPFFCSGRDSAFVNLATNDGFSVRAFEPYKKIDGQRNPAFAVALATRYDAAVENSLKERKQAKEWINFKRIQPGPRNMVYPVNSMQLRHYRMLDIKDIMDGSVRLDDGSLRGKIVLLGFCGEHPGAFSMNDRYYTPLNEKYSGRSLPDMHGVVVHANIASMLLDKDFIDEVGDVAMYGMVFLLLFCNYFCFEMLKGRNVYGSFPFARILQFMEFCLVFGLCIYLLAAFDVKLGFVTLAVAIALSYEIYEFYEHRLPACLAWLKRCFSQWLRLFTQNPAAS